MPLTTRPWRRLDGWTRHTSTEIVEINYIIYYTLIGWKENAKHRHVTPAYGVTSYMLCVSSKYASYSIDFVNTNAVCRPTFYLVEISGIRVALLAVRVT